MSPSSIASPTPSELAAAWLRMHLAGVKISKAAAAQRVGMPQQTFSRKVNGVTPFTIDELVHVADKLNIEICDWVDGVDKLRGNPLVPPMASPLTPVTPVSPIEPEPEPESA